MLRITMLVSFGVVVGFGFSAVRAEPSPPVFVTLDPLPGYQYCEPKAISGDGTTVVGKSASYPPQAFVWTAATGTESLGVLKGADRSLANGVSADGSVIVGWSGLQFEAYAFRWTRRDGMNSLALTPYYATAEAIAVSADGNVIAGNIFLSGNLTGFRWTEANGMTALGSLGPNPPNTSRVHGISANGVVLVGDTDPGGNGQQPMRWTATSGMQTVYYQPGTPMIATAASANGSVIVGGRDAFRWTAATGGQDLPNMDLAFSVSADGTVIVGRDANAIPAQARIWTEPCGSRSIRDLLLHAGLSEVENWQISVAFDIADDNRTLIGVATNPQRQNHGFVARLPKTGDVTFDGIVNIDDILLTINAWGPCESGTYPFLDFNCDNVIDVQDLASVIAHWD